MVQYPSTLEFTCGTGKRGSAWTPFKSFVHRSFRIESKLSMGYCSDTVGDGFMIGIQDDTNYHYGNEYGKFKRFFLQNN